MAGMIVGSWGDDDGARLLTDRRLVGPGARFDRQGFVQPAAEGGRRELRRGPVFPLDCQRLAAAQGAPGVAGDDRPGGIDRDDMTHAGHRQRRSRIEAARATAGDRRAAEDGIELILEPHVGGVARLAGDDLGTFEPARRLADEAELTRPARGRAFRHRQAGGLRRELADADAADAAGAADVARAFAKNDPAVGERAGAGLDLPSRRRRRDEHLARRRRRLAQRHPMVRGAVRRARLEDDSRFRKLGRRR